MSESKISNPSSNIELEKSSIGLPLYLRILDNKLLIGVLTPIGFWLFFVFGLGDLLSKQGIKQALFNMWLIVGIFFILIIYPLTLLLASILKSKGIAVCKQNKFNTFSDMFTVKELYLVLSRSIGVKRILIWLLMLIKALIPFFAGWGYLGGIIVFFAAVIS